DAHQQEPDRQRGHHHGLLTGRRRWPRLAQAGHAGGGAAVAFDASASGVMVAAARPDRQAHYGTSSTATSRSPSRRSVIRGSRRWGGPANGSPVRTSKTPSWQGQKRRI